MGWKVGQPLRGEKKDWLVVGIVGWVGRISTFWFEKKLEVVSSW